MKEIGREVGRAIAGRIVASLAMAAIPLFVLLVIVVGQMAAVSSSSGGMSVCDRGVPLTASEREVYYAKVIAGVARQMGFGEDLKKAMMAALVTVAQESHFKNLANDGVYTPARDRAVTESEVQEVGRFSQAMANDGVGTDNDSVGLFQQRVFAGWAVYPHTRPHLTDTSYHELHVRRLMDPVWQSQSFFLTLRDTPGWQGMSAPEAAQRVQRSKYPAAYEKHVDRAEVLFEASKDAPEVHLLPETLTWTGGSEVSFGKEGGDVPVNVCRVVEVVGVVSAGAEGVIASARAHVGGKYVWGGGDLSGPTGGGFDCSGLVRFAVFQGTGLELPRKASAQYRHVTGVLGWPQIPYGSPEDLRAGDLVFFASRGSDRGASITHVAIASGPGRLVEAKTPAKGIVEGPIYPAGRLVYVVRPPYEGMQGGRS